MTITDAPRTEIGTAQPGLMPWSGIVDTTEVVPELAWPTSVRTYDRMRYDAQLAGTILALTLPIRRYRWTIDPDGAAPSVAADVAQQLGLPVHGQPTPPQGRLRKRFSHDDHLRHALLALVFGHSFMEQVGTIEAVPGGRQRWQLRKLAPRLPASISEIVVARDGGLEAIVQYGTGRPGDPAAPRIPIASLVAYVWDREGGNWLGRSMLRPAYPHYLLKDRLLRVDAVKHERNGMGVPIIEAPPGATAAQVKELASLAEQYRGGASSGAALPAGAQLHLKGVEGSIPDAIASIRYHDQQMSRMVLEMFMDLGTTDTGSRALGAAFIDFFALAQEAIADWYATTTTAHVIEDIVDWNWGPDEPAPKLVFEPTHERELALADLGQMVASGTITVTPDLEAYLRDRYRLPALDADKLIVPDPSEAVPGADAKEVADKVNAATSLFRAGFDAQAALKAVGLPPIEHTGLFPVTIKPADMSPDDVAKAEAAIVASGERAQHRATGPDDGQRRRQAVAAARQPSDVEQAAHVDHDAIRTLSETAVAGLVDTWAKVRAGQVEDLAAQVEAAANQGNMETIAAVAAAPAGQEELGSALAEVAVASAGLIVAEAHRQGAGHVQVPDVDALTARQGSRAAAVAALMAAALSTAAARKAVAVTGPTATGADVAGHVRDHLDSLTDAYPIEEFGGAVHESVAEGRAEVIDAYPPNRVVGSELLDTNTCGPCSEIDGTEYGSQEEAQVDYPAGGYTECDGGSRCRGILVAIWDPDS